MKRRSQSDLIRWLNIAGYAVIIVGVIFLSVSLFKAIQINDRISQEQSYDLSGAATYSDNTTIKQVNHSATKKVLILASYDPTYIYYQDQIAGMLSVSDANDIEFDVVNLDTFKHHTKTDLALIDKIVEQRLADGHYSGVIAMRDPALRYVMDHQDDYFKDLPILFAAWLIRSWGSAPLKTRTSPALPKAPTSLQPSTWPASFYPAPSASSPFTTTAPWGRRTPKFLRVWPAKSATPASISSR